MQLKNGMLLVLPRSEARTFFSHKDDATRLEFINELIAKPSVPRLDCEGKWQELHDQLAKIPLESSMLDQAILGGRPVHQGDDYHICLVRPDVVGFIAELGAGLKESQCELLWAEILKVIAIYQQAADLQAAMVFVAKRDVE